MENAETAAWCERLARLPTAVVSDVLAAMGLQDRVLAAAIKPIEPGGALAGPALCLRGVEGHEPVLPPGTPKPVYEMDRRITKGSVAVIAAGGHRVGAVIGGNVGISFLRRGCRGVVTDGGIRDAAEFAEIGLTVFASFITPLSNKGQWSFTEIDVDVALPGQQGREVRVRSGDLMHGDRDGVVVIPRAHAAQAIAAAETVERVEGRIRQLLEAGEDREAVYRRNDRFGHIRPVGA